jgi:carbonic anhydrase
MSAGRTILVMADFDALLRHNRDFARTDARNRVPAIPFLPHQQLYVVTCIDPRVDPHPLLGLELGDAIVARTVGGRVTPAVLQDLAWITHLHREKTPDAGWFDLAVVHHTDCGAGLFADDELRRGFASRHSYDEAALRDLAVVDPGETVRTDVDRVRRSASIDLRVRVSGWSYDVATGLLTEVVRPAASPDPAAIG